MLNEKSDMISDESLDWLIKVAQEGTAFPNEKRWEERWKEMLSALKELKQRRQNENEN
jgi:hypothetical protein